MIDAANINYFCEIIPFMDKTIISILGGLAGMFGWGTSDFFANISSEKIGHQKKLFFGLR